jgi:hypothetical protein
MKPLLLCFAAMALLSVNPASAADSGSITIVSPKDGAVLGGGGNKLEYNVHLSPNGSHLHIYIDNQDPIIGKNVSNCPCSIGLPALAAGKHTIVVKEATAGHALTGVQSTVTVNVK